MMLGSVIRALRPKQWAKNAVVLAALVFAMGDTTQGELTRQAAHTVEWAILGALLFCLASSSIYLLNDILDVELDRAHPVKRLRPIAAGELPVGFAYALSLALTILSLAGAWWLERHFFYLLTGYITLQIAYTLALKRMALLDIFIISAGFVMRALAGALVIRAHISPWLLICTFLLALFLALCKRRHELVSLKDDSGATRHSLRQYDKTLLDALIPLTGSSTLVCYSIYTLWPETIAKFGTTHLSYTIPFVAFGLFRYLDLVYRREQGGRPEQLLLTDIPLLATVAAYGLTVLGILLVK